MSIAFIVRNVLRLDTFSCAFGYDHQQATGVVGHERDTIATRSFVFMSDALVCSVLELRGHCKWRFH